jgi:hypothetical protein
LEENEKNREDEKHRLADIIQTQEGQDLITPE